MFGFDACMRLHILFMSPCDQFSGCQGLHTRCHVTRQHFFVLVLVQCQAMVAQWWLLLCCCGSAGSQIIFAFIMMPHTLPQSYVRWIRKQGAKELYVWQGVRVSEWPV